MLYYGLVCTAIAEDRQELRDGVRLLASIVHKHNIPITWAITADSAQFLAKDISVWHNEFGDEPLLMLDIKTIWDKNLSSLGQQSEIEDEDIQIIELTTSPEVLAEQLVNMRENLPKYIRTEWRKIERAMDWTVPSIVGAEWKHEVLVNVLEQAGFRGLWGYRWDERGTDAEADRGCPFGYFYPSAEQHNFSTPAAGSIAGIPYDTASHLQKKRLNLRASLLNETIQGFYDIYVENQKWNRWLSFVEHVNVLDVKQLGQESLEKLDSYFAAVSNCENVRFLPLSDIVDDYWTNCQQTEPTYIVADTSEEFVDTGAPDIENPPTNSGNAPQKPTRKKVFYYYDAECQFTFSEGQMEPTQMNNYISPPIVEGQVSGFLSESASLHGIEYHIPKIADFRPIRKRSQLHIIFSVESTKSMPYGIAVWGNHLGLQLENSNAKAVTWVDEHLLFIRLALENGKNEFEIVLTI